MSQKILNFRLMCAFDDEEAVVRNRSSPWEDKDAFAKRIVSGEK